MLLLYETQADFVARSTVDSGPHFAAWRAYYTSLVDAGVYVTGAPLQPESSATTVRVEDGRRRVQDGPYANTKEQLGGAIVLEVASLDAALEWAARCPTAATGVVEVRPVSDAVRQAVEGGGG
jgi:hypothetical protein